jgi:hypothetical protein
MSVGYNLPGAHSKVISVGAPRYFRCNAFIDPRFEGSARWCRARRPQHCAAIRTGARLGNYGLGVLLDARDLQPNPAAMCVYVMESAARTQLRCIQIHLLTLRCIDTRRNSKEAPPTARVEWRNDAWLIDLGNHR